VIVVWRAVTLDLARERELGSNAVTRRFSWFLNRGRQVKAERFGRRQIRISLLSEISLPSGL